MNTKSIETVIYACYFLLNLEDDCNIRERKGVNIVQENARKMQSNRGDLGTDDNCYFKNIYKTKHFLYLYPGFAEEQAIGDGDLTLIEVNMF